MTVKAKYITALVLVLVIALGSFYGGYKYGKSKAPAPPVYMSQEEAETQQGQHKAAEESNINLTPSQEKKFAEAVANSDDREPDKRVETTGGQLPSVLSQLKQEAKADIQIVTPDNGSQASKGVTDNKANTGQIKLDSNTPVNLKVFNEKAFPDTLKELTIYPAWRGMEIKAVDAAVLHETKIFGWKPYLGPTLSWDKERRDKWRVGIRLTDAK